MKFIDIAGQKFGRLRVVQIAGRQRSPHGGQRIMWECVCDCGNTHVASGHRLRHGDTKSCGCLRAEMQSKASTTHGLRHTRLYKVWHDMKMRCQNPNEPGYKYYGGRGITVCAEWQDDVAAFYEWAMSAGYDKDAPRGKCTLDRINNDGCYEPGNCRWVDMMTQAHNKRASANH